MDGRMDGRADAICWAGIFWRGIFKSSPMGVSVGVTSALPNRAAPSAPPGLFRPCHPVSPRGAGEKWGKVHFSTFQRSACRTGANRASMNLRTGLPQPGPAAEGRRPYVFFCFFKWYSNEFCKKRTKLIASPDVRNCPARKYPARQYPLFCHMQQPLFCCICNRTAAVRDNGPHYQGSWDPWGLQGPLGPWGAPFQCQNPFGSQVNIILRSTVAHMLHSIPKIC